MRRLRVEGFPNLESKQAMYRAHRYGKRCIEIEGYTQKCLRALGSAVELQDMQVPLKYLGGRNEIN